MRKGKRKCNTPRHMGYSKSSSKRKVFGINAYIMKKGTSQITKELEGTKELEKE